MSVVIRSAAVSSLRIRNWGSLVAIALALGACGRKDVPAESPATDSHSAGYAETESAVSEESAGSWGDADSAPATAPMAAAPAEPGSAAVPPPPARARLERSESGPAKSKAAAGATGRSTSKEALIVESDDSIDDGTRDVAKRAPMRRPSPTMAIAQPELTAGMFDDNQSFDFFQRYRAEIMRRQMPGVPDFGRLHEISHSQYAAEQHRRARLDISLVVDTTGSMGDELAYLQGEFRTISSQIAERYPNSEQRWSLIVYRDLGDEYVVRQHPFTHSLNDFQLDLSNESFGGGGDYPEAPDQALASANQLRWRSEADVARLLFWVADAPHHTERAGALRDAVAAAKKNDIHIYPVASSGVDELTEFTMRSAAQITHGRYVFLTDDSGVGNSHKEPTLPCYYVTTLSDAILRAVGTEMTGKATLPPSERVIRQVGRIDGQGRCDGRHGAWAF